MRRSVVLFSVAALAGCAAPGPVPVLPARAPGGTAQFDPPRPTDPQNVGTIVVLEVEMPEAGTAIGEQYAGVQFAQRIGRLHITEDAQRRWAAVARAEADSFLRGAGYSVRAMPAPSSDAEPVEGVRFGLSGTVHQLDVRTEGRMAPVRIQARAAVAWELLDLAAGRVIFGLELEGRAEATDSIDIAALRAVRQSLVALLADQSFQEVLRTPRASVAGEELSGGAFTRRMPGRRDIVVLRPEDLNVMPVTDADMRVAAGLVQFRGREGTSASGFILSRDGLAVADSRIAHNSETRPWVIFPSGVQRRARLVRARGRLALLQVACDDPCRTVAWSPGPWPADGTPLAVVGELWRIRGTVQGGCGLFSGAVRALDFPVEVLGVGGPVSLGADGTVVGVVTRPGCVTPLAVALRNLGVRLESAPR